MNRKQQQTEETKARLLDAAFAIFSTRGYVSASVEEIALATGTSKANIYYHYKSKEGLFLALLDRHDAEWQALWEEQRARCRTVAELLQTIVEVGLPKGFNHPLNRAIWEFLDAGAGRSEASKRSIAEWSTRKRRFMEAVLRDGLEQGELKPHLDPSHLAMTLDSLFRGLGETTRHMELPQALELHRTAIQVCLHGMLQASTTNTKE
ncbi:TetR/AcrR family transcriptional regulator [Paenibacillus sp. PL2-23]|uniref:TetR/AcrR family transcriptional regulator n=1 Tax=Paenibacillus sp. PL2-23 TaxID=2100729 RepID=UPI0030FC6DC1